MGGVDLSDKMILYYGHAHRSKEVYIEKKTSLYLLFDDYVLSIADGTSVSTFLFTRKLGPEEVSVSLTATQIFDELTEVLLQGSK